MELSSPPPLPPPGTGGSARTLPPGSLNLGDERGDLEPDGAARLLFDDLAHLETVPGTLFDEREDQDRGCGPYSISQMDI